MSLFLLEPVAKPGGKQHREVSSKKKKKKGTNPKLLPVFLVIVVTDLLSLQEAIEVDCHLPDVNNYLNEPAVLNYSEGKKKSVTMLLQVRY